VVNVQFSKIECSTFLNLKIMAGLQHIQKGDYFKYYNPNFPRTAKIGIMLAVEVNLRGVSPKGQETRFYPLQYCTKVETCNCVTMHYYHHMNTQDVNGVCTMCNKQRV
jgi:hypothetical protein